MNYKITEKNGNKVFEKEAQNENEAKIQVFDDFFEIKKAEEKTSEIPLEYYFQRNKRYKGLKLGNSNVDFQNNSCFLCSLSFLAKKDPLEVHELLKKSNCFSGAMIKSKETAEVLGLELLKGNSNIPGKMTDINYMPKFNCIKEVYLGKSQHFVVRLVDENGNRQIFDPWTGKYLPINFYKFKSYRLFENKIV